MDNAPGQVLSGRLPRLSTWPAHGPVACRSAVRSALDPLLYVDIRTTPALPRRALGAGALSQTTAGHHQIPEGFQADAFFSGPGANILQLLDETIQFGGVDASVTVDIQHGGRTRPCGPPSPESRTAQATPLP